MSKKEFKEYKFHSHLLYPTTIAEKGEEGMKHFDDLERKYHKFTTGDKVVHVAEPKQMMFVTDAIYEKGKIKGKDGDRLDGILCHWYQ